MLVPVVIVTVAGKVCCDMCSTTADVTLETALLVGQLGYLVVKEPSEFSVDGWVVHQDRGYGRSGTKVWLCPSHWKKDRRGNVTRSTAYDE